ncbi:MASE1 domain-containing protein [Thiohalophilus thiocyanatoxydans]|uniref:MASE1 domain-containing protein n=1 Tax=Thiohalophilus thiocyanatoxydans TaxID=381308 RepID=UPI001064C05C|nr:MASE1 domain-containing protein [Thiohalophilus thiocyanatoxydans]
MLNLKSRFILPGQLTWPGSLKSSVLVLLFGFTYFLLGEVGLGIDTGYAGVTPFWPPSGLALLVFILYGPRYWPGIFIGIGLLAYSQAMPLAVAFLAACGHVLEALAGWYLLNRFWVKLDFRRVTDVLHFAAIAFSAPLISSLFGSTAMMVSNLVSWTDFILVWSMWWLGDATGILLLVPFVLIWRNLLYYCRDGADDSLLGAEIGEDCQYILKSNRIGQLSIYVVLLTLAALYGFSGAEVNTTGRLGLFYLVLPLTVFIAISFEQFGATLASILVSIILLFSYHPGWGPYPGSSDILNLLIVVIFICITVITAMVVAALFTERRQSEKALRKSHKRLQESELRLRQLSENIHEVFWLVDANDSHVIYISPSCRDTWGREPGAFYENPGEWGASLHPEDRERVFAEFENFKHNGRFEMQYRIVRPDGDVRWIRDKGFPVYNEAGYIYRLAGIAEDITEQKLAEEQKLQQEEERSRLSRYISVGELGNSLAHEINQPLTSIMCYAQGGLNRSKEGRLSEKDIQDIFGRLSGEAERAGRIINKLRDFVKRKDIRFSPVDINALLQDSLQLVDNKIKTGDVRVTYVLGDSLPLIMTDPVLTQQVILNLVINAVESMQEVESERVLTIVTEQGGDYVTISFRDTGIGIPQELQKEIFAPLFTTKQQGVGLGLSIASSIIESMGGELRAWPGDGSGYVFAFSLPIRHKHDRSSDALSNW